MTVHLLLHRRKNEHGEVDGKLVGIYATEALAKAVAARLVALPGFRSHPQGFRIGLFELDVDYWSAPEDAFTADPDRCLSDSTLAEAQVLTHAYEVDTDDSFEDVVRYIGCFSIEAKAAAARERLSGTADFAAHPEGFHLEVYTVGEDHWTEGFISWAEAAADE